MSDYCDVGILGLATIGANLARNAARRGYRVAVYNRHDERTDHLIQKFGDEGNIVYTCGALLRACELLLPFAVADDRRRFCTVSIDQLVAKLDRQ
jgi:3-hydroxyisobutyrate dehydrogenase-like beta-hydroxyacid dehydrogenase